MELDVLGLLGACSYALDCVEAELVHVTSRHAKRVAYMSVCTAETLGVHGNALQDLAACALLHDNALTQYIQEEFHGNAESLDLLPEIPHLGLHCSQGEENIRNLPFSTDVSGVILYHHENADGSGPFGKTWGEIPLAARIIHLCVYWMHSAAPINSPRKSGTERKLLFPGFAGKSSTMSAPKHS